MFCKRISFLKWIVSKTETIKKLILDYTSAKSGSLYVSFILACIKKKPDKITRLHLRSWKNITIRFYKKAKAGKKIHRLWAAYDKENSK